jgi:hypothetical protein
VNGQCHGIYIFKEYNFWLFLALEQREYKPNFFGKFFVLYYQSGHLLSFLCPPRRGWVQVLPGPLHPTVMPPRARTLAAQWGRCP